MKRVQVILLVATACIFFGAVAHAQMGMDFFKRPTISAIFRPVVGNGAVYESSGSGSKDTIEMLVVGKESAGGKDAYWLEFSHDTRDKGTMYAKFLLSRDDFQVHRMIFQMPGQGAMEMPANMMAMQNSHKIVEEMNNWSQVGNESVTVPAGTFTCSHWKKNDGTNEVWASDTVSPFGMVKSVGSGRTEVLVKVLTGVKDHITGPVSTFQMPAIPQNQ
jgi:hypothetical protein